jgi:iron complex transport system permease protein
MTGVLLMGVILAFFSSALILLVRFMSNPLEVVAMDQWMLGGLSVSGWGEVFPSLPFLIVGLMMLAWHIQALGQIEFNEEVARARGIKVARVQKIILVGGSLVTAAVVSVVGPIGFIGLLVPHLVRKILGTDPKWVFLGSMWVGGSLLVLADTLARSIPLLGRGAELPVGLLTTLMGAPLFLMLLLRRNEKSL